MILFLPRFLHGIRRKKELTVFRVDFDMAAYVSELLGHGVYRLSFCCVCSIDFQRYIKQDFKYWRRDHGYNKQDGK